MRFRFNRSITLIELLIAVSLLSVIVLAFMSIDVFSRYHVSGSDIRIRLQNEVSLILDHMAKNIGRSIGNEQINGADSVVTVTPNVSIRAYIDGSGDGERQDPIAGPGTGDDRFIMYRFDDSGPNANLVRYCPRCQNISCNFNQCLDAVDVLGSHIITFEPSKPSSPLAVNYVDVNVRACWNPASLADCGSPDNPDVIMRTRVKMPSVSTN